MSKLLDTLAAELERSRELSPRVVNYISATYGVDYDTMGAFLVDTLSGLEDDELDLVLSPVFTPTLADQSVFAELLGRESLSRDQWPTLVRQLAARPVRARLVTSDGKSHPVTLREVTIERYVYRLRLDGSIPELLFELIERTAAQLPLLKAIARRAVWENHARQNILARYLTAAASSGNFMPADALELLNFVENFKPVDLTDLISEIPRRQQALREQLNIGSGPKPFFSEHVQIMHGGGRDQRQQEDFRNAAKENELRFLERLEQLFAG